MKSKSSRSRGGARRSTCEWCGQIHDHSESYCFILNEREIRSRVLTGEEKVGDLYLNGKLQGKYIHTTVEEKLVRRQKRLAEKAAKGRFREGYTIPKNIAYILEHDMVWSQIVHEKPWAVYVLIDGKRRRKRFNNLWSAVQFHSEVTKKHPSAGIVSLAKAYELPAEWRLKRDKLPAKWKWCPRCVTFRVFHRVDPPQRFEAEVKKWSETKGRYIWTYRSLWLTECQLCGHTNRDPAFRRSNQPFELRRIKKGVHRVKPRRATARKQ